MRGHEVRHEVLVEVHFFVQLFVALDEAAVDGILRLTHHAQHAVGNMLRCDFELAADVVFNKLAEERFVFVIDEVIEPNAGAHKDFFHFGQCAQLAQEGNVIRVVDLHVGAWLREQTLAVFTHADLHLLFAGGLAEVCRGAADVVNVAFKIGILGHFFRFFQKRFVAAGLNDAALVERQRAEAACAEAPAAAGKTEFHFFNGGDAAEGFVIRVIGARIGQGVGVIHFFGRKRHLRRILHDEQVIVRVGLDERFRRERVGVEILIVKAFRVQLFTGGNLIEAGEVEHVVAVGRDVRFIHGTADERELLHGDAAAQGFGNLDDGALAHTIGNDIRAGIEQDGALHFVRPVIIMRKAAQAGLDAADDDGRFLKRAADEVGIYDDGVIRAQAHFAAGGEKVAAAALFGDGIVVHHGIHIAGGNEKAKFWLAECAHAFGVAPVRLCDNADRETVCFENAGDDRRAERRVVDVGIAADVHEIELFDAAYRHIFF